MLTSLTTPGIIEKMLSIELLEPGAFQPRQQFEPSTLQSLADSIRQVGILQPLVVRSKGQGRYEIIAGERRWRAAQLAGLSQVPCRVGEFSDDHALKIALIENLLRENLNPIELASSMERMANEFRLSHEEIAAALGKSRPEVTNLLRLLKLDTRVRILLTNGELTESHGKLLAGLGQSEQYVCAREAVAKSLSTRALEQMIKNNALTSPSKKSIPGDKDVLRLERSLTEHLGFETKMRMKAKQKGTLQIHFGSLEELEGILARLGYSHDN